MLTQLPTLKVEPPRTSWPGEEFPRTHGWPQLAKVFIRVKDAPVRERAVVQVLDFYREGA
jgi:hypothetical protein